MAAQAAATQAPGSRQRSGRRTVVQTAQQADVKSAITSEHDAVKAEDSARGSGGAPGFVGALSAERRTRKRKADPLIKQEQPAVKSDRDASQTEAPTVKAEPLSTVRPSKGAAVKLEGWAEEAGAAKAAASSGKVNLDKAPTAAPLGPVPEFPRPLPEECQASTMSLSASQ